MTGPFNNPAALVGADDLTGPVTLIGVNDLTPEIVEDEATFRAWQSKTRVAGAELISHDTPGMHDAWTTRQEHPGQRNAIDLLMRYEWARREPTGVLLIGRPGRGKSWLAGRSTLRLRALAEPVVWISVARMLDDLRDAARGEQAGLSVTRYRQRLEEASWLVLDDLGAERPTDFAREQLCTLFDTRFDHRKTRKTLITTNLDVEELEDRLGPRATSRLFGLCKNACVEVTGTDLRLPERTAA